MGEMSLCHRAAWSLLFELWEAGWLLYPDLHHPSVMGGGGGEVQGGGRSPHQHHELSNTVGPHGLHQTKNFKQWENIYPPFCGWNWELLDRRNCQGSQRLALDFNIEEFQWVQPLEIWQGGFWLHFHWPLPGDPRSQDLWGCVLLGGGGEVKKASLHMRVILQDRIHLAEKIKEMCQNSTDDKKDSKWSKSNMWKRWKQIDFSKLLSSTHEFDSWPWILLEGFFRKVLDWIIFWK